MFRFALYLLAMTLWAQTSLACSCGRVAGAEELLDRSDAVFTGVVTAVKSRPGRVAETTFRITEAFKGVRRGTTVAVRHRSGPSPSCGVTFEKGATYTLSAHRAGDGFETGLCSTWMFLPHIPSSGRLILEMRALRQRQP
jgi:hypothetical protein